MRRRKKKEREFKPGQVVACRFPGLRRDWFGKIKHRTQSGLFRLEDAQGDFICWAMKSEIRHLTKEEGG